VNSIRRALERPIAEGKHVPGVISTRDLVRLDRALGSARPFPPELYATLRLFVQISWRIGLPDASRRCNLGDALEAIAELASALPRWPFASSVEPRAFHALEYVLNADGLDHQYRSNVEGWGAHGERSKAFIREALRTVGGGRTAWVLGAGRAYDLPLPELAEAFDEIVLVDIDRGALEKTVGALEPSLRRRFELVAADLTGIAEPWREKVLEAVRGARDARAAAERLEELYCGYVVGDDRAWGALGAGADLVVSQMLLSQLNDSLERYPRRLYEDRFGMRLFERHPRLRAANMLFAHRVQHDHLRFLRRHARAAVLTSDVAERYTELNAFDEIAPVGDEMLLLGAYRLAERVPQGLAVAREDEWYWHRVVPRGEGQVGSRMRISALLLVAQEAVGSGPRRVRAEAAVAAQDDAALDGDR
jgi:hypothetical protein